MAVEAVKKPAAVVEEEPAADSKDLTVKLQKAVQAHGETIKEIKFRRPTGGDLMGLTDWPIVIDYQTGRVSPNPPVMGAMMSTLAGVPPSTIRQLEAQDWTTCSHRLMGFFVPAA
jgi:hypothetical protein